MTKKGKAGSHVSAAKPHTTGGGAAFTQAQAADLRELAALHRDKQERRNQRKLTRELDRRYKRRSKRDEDDSSDSQSDSSSGSDSDTSSSSDGKKSTVFQETDFCGYKPVA